MRSKISFRRNESENIHSIQLSKATTIFYKVNRIHPNQLLSLFPSLACIQETKIIDNDVYPIHQTLGAITAAEQGSLFFNNIVNENTTSSRQLIIHEVIGRNCGWLTAATAHEYRKLFWL